MCVRIILAAQVVAPWSSSLRTITVPAGLSAARTLLAVRATLATLGVQQPASGAVCWCGEPVENTQFGNIPTQRQPSEVSIGA